MKHATKSRDLLYNNGIYRNPLQRYRAILTMVTRATLARSPPVYPIALKFDRYLGSTAADVPVIFQSDAII